MTENQTQDAVQENKPNDKEYNFRAIEARLRREEQARLEAEKRAQEAERRAQEIEARRSQVDEEDDDSEPYVDKKKLEKKLARFGQSTKSEIQKSMEEVKYAAKEELKQEMWLENNPDFYDVLQHAEKFAARAPEMAKTILRMPEGFDRQKLVYQSIKELGLDKPEQKQSSVQEKIDANRRSPYYQPSGVAAAPYAGAGGDFSTAGQKNAYNKMQELKSRLRLG
jgi:actin-related protein